MNKHDSKRLISMFSLVIVGFLYSCQSAPIQEERKPSSLQTLKTSGSSEEVVYSSTYRKPMSIKDPEQVSELPTLPFLLKGCEGTCCGRLNSNQAFKSIQLLAGTDVQSRPIGVIAKNEIFEKADFYIKVTRLGKALKESKEIVLLSYMDEGKWFTWMDRKPAMLEGLDDLDDKLNGVKKDPLTESWAQFKTTGGIVGWAKLPSQGKGTDLSLDYHECSK